MSSNVNHPAHYGGEDNPYEVIRVLRAWNLEGAKWFCWGNVIKYLARAHLKGGREDYDKADWYADQLASIEAELAKRPKPPPPHIGGGMPVTCFSVFGLLVEVDWEKREYRVTNPDSNSGKPVLSGSGRQPRAAQVFTGVKRCNSSYGCVHGYHGRQCPLYREEFPS